MAEADKMVSIHCTADKSEHKLPMAHARMSGTIANMLDGIIIIIYRHLDVQAVRTTPHALVAWCRAACTLVRLHRGAIRPAYDTGWPLLAWVGGFHAQ